MGSYVIIQTVLVYLLLLFVLYKCSLVAQEKEKWYYLIIGVVIYSIIFGMRYFVGNDWFSYKLNYETLLQTNGSWGEKDNLEDGFAFLSSFMASCHFPSDVYFGVLAFIQLFLVYYALRKDIDVYRWVSIVFILGCFWLGFSNGIRQSIAICLWLCALFSVAQKRVIHYYMFIFIATYFHHSSVILGIFYPILFSYEEWFKNVKLQIVALIVSLVLMYNSFIQGYISSLESLLVYVGYDKYVNYSEELFSTNNSSLGIGFYVTLLLNFCIIYFSNITKENFGKSVTHLYNFVFIGILCKYIFFDSHIVLRFTSYFYTLSFVFGSFVLYTLKNRNKHHFFLVFSCYILTFIAYMYKMTENTSLFIFTWQEDLYYLKSFLFED